MTVTIKYPGEGISIENRVCIINIVRNYRGCKGLVAGQIRVEVEVGCKDETFIVIVGIVCKSHQVGNVGDLVRGAWVARAAGVFGKNCCR